MDLPCPVSGGGGILTSATVPFPFPFPYKTAAKRKNTVIPDLQQQQNKIRSRRVVPEPTFKPNCFQHNRLELHLLCDEQQGKPYKTKTQEKINGGTRNKKTRSTQRGIRDKSHHV